MNLWFQLDFLGPKDTCARNARVILCGGGVHPFFRAKCYNGKHLPSTNKKSPEELRDVAHLMLMKASSPPVRSSNSRVSWVSTSNAAYWNISNRQNEWTGFFSVATGQCQRELIYKTPESSSASSCSPYFSLVIMPLAYKRLRKWRNETSFPRLSSSVFSCLQASFHLDEDEWGIFKNSIWCTVYIYIYIYRRLYNICTIYSTNLTEVRKAGSKSTFGLTFFEGNNKDSDIHPASKKNNSPLNPKKQWWVHMSNLLLERVYV